MVSKTGRLKAAAFVEHKLFSDSVCSVYSVVNFCLIQPVIYVLPAWPRAWNVDFKLHALHDTTVEVTLDQGVIKRVHVSPASRAKDIVLPVWK